MFPVSLAAPAAPAPRPDTAKADTTKKDKPGYKPSEVRITVSTTRDTPKGTVVLRGARALTDGLHTSILSDRGSNGVGQLSGHSVHDVIHTRPPQR